MYRIFIICLFFSACINQKKKNKILTDSGLFIENIIYIEVNTTDSIYRIRDTAEIKKIFLKMDDAVIEYAAKDGALQYDLSFYSIKDSLMFKVRASGRFFRMDNSLYSVRGALID